MSDGVRARNRAAIEAEILRVGRDQLAEVGAAALSLRAVARDLGMVSSAVYRYVESRDELLTLLIVDAYDSLGDHVDEAMEAATDRPARERFAVLCRSIRGWALGHPHQYALLYGSPVPHYQAPAERTNAAGTRVPAHFVALLGGARAPSSAVGSEAMAAAGQALEPVIAEEPFFSGSGVPGEALARGYVVWSLVFGALSAELFEQLGADALPDPEAQFEAVIEIAADVVLGGTG